MSSSNSVRVTFIEEATLGTTPGSGNFSTLGLVSEGLSGSPETTQSTKIRSDRLASGQIVTGLTVGGPMAFELAKDAALENLMESAMLNDWTTQSLVTVNLTIDGSTKQITRASGTWATLLTVGDYLTLTGFVNSGNNTQVQVVEFISATIIRVIAADVLVTETGTGTTYKRADKLTIGTTKKSFSIEKAFTDLTTKALIYKGMMANSMNINVAYGEIISGTFEFSGTKYVEANASGEFITNGRTIDAAATTNSLNGSIDMPLVSSSVLGTLSEVDFCIQSVGLTLNNNMQALTCIGEAAPADYSPGQADVEVTLSAYLSDTTWDIIPKKLSQDPFSLGFMVKNTGGWFGFYLPAIQVTFDDPASAGANQTISLDMTGVGKVGSSGESSLVLYRS